MICNDQHLKNEIKHLKKVLRCINGYPIWIIQQAIEKVKNQKKMARPAQVTSNNEENKHLLMLLYKKKTGETRLKSLEKSIIPANITYKIIYIGLKLA